MAKLVVQSDEGAPVTHELGLGTVTVGRETDNTVIIADASVSRHHAEIISRDGTSTLRDLDSANGSRVNGEFVTETPLKKGDVIHFGGARAIFVVEPAILPKPENIIKVPVPPPAPAIIVVEKPAAVLPKPENIIKVPVPPPAPAIIVVEKPAAVLPKPENLAKIPVPPPAPAPTKSRLLIGGAIFLAAAVAVTAFLHPRPNRTEARRTLKPAVIVDPRPAATRAFWDRLEQMESTGSQKAHDFPFDPYPQLPNGLYDFQRLADDALGSLLDSLMERARYLSRVSQDIGALDSRNVDADLIAYRKDLRAEWEGAASLDFNAANLVWAVHVRRTRFPATGSSARELFDASAGESRTEQENQENVAEIAKLMDAWLVQRDQFLVAGAKVAAKKKEVNLRLTERYKLEFK